MNMVGKHKDHRVGLTGDDAEIKAARMEIRAAFDLVAG